MPHSKFNWRSMPAAAAQNSDGTFGFGFGDTWKLTDHNLVKPENAKGCTLDVSLEHDSKLTQLQLVCNASALQVSVVQAMNAQEFKWITQMRGTPLPNQPDAYYFRTPEELLTQKLWRLRVKFLFSSTAISAVRIQTLSLSFEKLTRRGSSGKGSNSRSGGGGGNSLYRNDMTSLAGSGGGGGIGMMPRAVVPMLYPGPGSTSTTTSTTASMTTTPTGTSTPCSVSVYGDGDVVSELSEEASTRSLFSRTPDSTSSGSSGSSGSSSSSSSGSGGWRRATTSRSDREAIRGLMEAIDQVISQGGNSSVLVDELLRLKERLADDLSQRSSEQHLNATIARISTIIQSIGR